MTRRGVVLYGPPASGKDTITAELSRLGREYVLFEKLKTGDCAGRVGGYRLAERRTISQLRRLGLLIYENERYGNIYAVDRPTLDALFGQAAVPVVHMGQAAGVRALQEYPAEWLNVLLWCERSTTWRRARARGTGDEVARVAAWDETADDLAGLGPDELFSIRIETDHLAPGDAARRIHAATAFRRTAGEDAGDEGTDVPDRGPRSVFPHG